MAKWFNVILPIFVYRLSGLIEDCLNGKKNAIRLNLTKRVGSFFNSLCVC